MAVDDATDAWICRGISDGLGGIRRRKTADHEAVHAASPHVP